VAVAAALRNREALALGWEELTGSSKFNAAWPAAVQSQDPAGTVSYEYALPLGGPDLGASVTIAGNRWILGTSRPFTLEVAALPAANGKTAVQSIAFHTAPLATFAAAWSAALTADATLASVTAGLIPDESSTLAAMAEVLKTPRRFTYEAAWDQDMLHRRVELSPAP
jgi:hypothetical protein